MVGPNPHVAAPRRRRRRTASLILREPHLCRLTSNWRGGFPAVPKRFILHACTRMRRTSPSLPAGDFTSAVQTLAHAGHAFTTAGRELSRRAELAPRRMPAQTTPSAPSSHRQSPNDVRGALGIDGLPGHRWNPYAGLRAGRFDGGERSFLVHTDIHGIASMGHLFQRMQMQTHAANAAALAPSCRGEDETHEATSSSPAPRLRRYGLRAPPLGLAYIAAVARDGGHDAEISMPTHWI